MFNHWKSISLYQLNKRVPTYFHVCLYWHVSFIFSFFSSYLIYLKNKELWGWKTNTNFHNILLKISSWIIFLIDIIKFERSLKLNEKRFPEITKFPHWDRIIGVVYNGLKKCIFFCNTSDQMFIIFIQQGKFCWH